jgi:pimeloyl-ACP methyl ester carboxylesterase
MPDQIVRAFVVLSCLIWASATSAEEKQVELEINGKIALGDLVVPDGASVQNGVLLMTHGALAHKDQELMEALQRALDERGVATLAHTLTLNQDRRIGMFDCAVPHNHAHEDAIAEIAAWVDWLKRSGAKRVWGLGHSRGGIQMAWFAAEKGVLEKVVLVAPGTGDNPSKVTENYRRRFNADLTPILEKASDLVEKGKPDTMLDVPGFAFCPAGKASARSIVAQYAPDSRRATQSHVPKIKVPVLAITGTRDTVVPDVREKLGPLADGKKLRLEVIEGAGHMFLDFYAEDAADMIAAFLKH